MRLTALACFLVCLGSSCSCEPVGALDGGSGLDGGGTGGAAGGGAGGGGGGTGASGGGGGVTCGQYETACNGRCLATVNDPANCGACGRACQGSEVCTSGQCLPPSACPVGLTACNGRCVDLSSSNESCGACTAGAACGAGQGCSGGTCVAVVPLDGGGPGTCAGGGAPVLVGTPTGAQTCAGTLAQVTFRWALCSCTDISASAPINTDGFSSNLGPVDGGLGGSLGANGAYASANAFSIGGTMWLEGGLSAASAGRVRQDLNVGATCSGGGSQVEHDARVNGNVGALTVGGRLFVPASATVASNVTSTGGVVRGPVTVPAPCDCSPSQLVDIVGIIAHAKTNNDNASLGLRANALTNLSAPARLDLPCGRYFLDGINASQPTTIAVHGRTALFVEGDVSAARDLAFFVAPGAELDVFIGGSVSTSGSIRFGSPETPAQSRFYIEGTFASSAGGAIAGNFYLPRSSFMSSGATTVYGSVFCGALRTSNRLDLHYDLAILNAGQACATDGGLPRPVDGGTTQTCGSCRDCGNQACVNGACGACTDSSQCCAPLVCSQGMCFDPSIIIN